MVVLRELRRGWIDRLQKAGADAPAFEVSCLIENEFGWDPAAYILHEGEPVSEDAAHRVDLLIERRCKGEPLQYLLGWWEFYGERFVVTPEVLIPQPDTETLVEAALERMHPGMRVADLCSGSGCIAIVLAKRYPQVEVTAVELSGGAVDLLGENVRRHGCQNLSILRGDVLDGSMAEGRAFDLIVANPPYIRTADLKGLPVEVLKEPRMALDGGADGLRFYRGIAKIWKQTLAPGGTLLLEVGYDQAEAVTAILAGEGYIDIWTRRDLSGIVRVVGAQKG